MISKRWIAIMVDSQCTTAGFLYSVLTRPRCLLDPSTLPLSQRASWTLLTPCLSTRPASTTPPVQTTTRQPCLVAPLPSCP
jgi:hypothetical protein